MQRLPSAKVQQIAALLKALQQQEQLADLILVFSQGEGDGYLLAYNTEQPPEVTLPHCQVLRLADLRPEEHLAFDGPIVGMPAIDVLFPEIPTHGVSFCTIERLLPDSQPLLRHTSFRLAQTLLAHLEQLSPSERSEIETRGYAKVVQLALPALLAESPSLPILVHLPNDLHELLDRGLAGCLGWLDLTADDDAWERLAEQAAAAGGWSAALEETAAFSPQLTALDLRLIELRPVLRRAVGPQRLQALLRNLARRAWQGVRGRHSDSLRLTAYALAAEASLQPEDVGDLIALLPHQDLEHFIATGDAARLYRTPRPDLPGPGGALPDWLTDGAPLPADYGPAWFTFPPLVNLLTRVTGRATRALGPILWKAGLGAELARTFWLFSRDLMQGGMGWRQIGAHPAQITDLATRATLLYSLDDPWQWRQHRYPLFLEQCYDHLINCLISQEQAHDDQVGAALYFRGLRSWYACYAAEDPVYNLSSMAHALRTFLDASTDLDDKTGEAVAQRINARQLLDLSEALLRPDHEAGRWPLAPQRASTLPFELAQYLRSFADTRAPLQIPSPPFKHQLQDYWTLHTAWRREQAAIAADRPSGERLEDLLHRYQQRMRVAHVPAHEKALLLRGYENDIAAIRRLQQALEFGPAIRLNLRTPWVVKGVRENLRLDIENYGTAAAEQFELEILPSTQFTTLRETTRLTLGEFPPGTVEQMQFVVRAQEPTLTLNIAYRYRDCQGQIQSEQAPLTVEVRPASERQWTFVESPYEAGIAVFGPQRFFGRQRELTEIFTRLIGGITQPIMLRGPRRLGKTSVLRQIAWLLNHPDDLMALGLTAAQIARLLQIRPASITLQSLSETATRAATQFFETALAEIAAALGEYTSKPGAETLGRNPVRGFTQQIGALLAQYPNTRLLVIVDEWDEVRRQEFNALERNLRSVMLEEQRVNWIVSSTWALSQEVRRYGSPFYNMCHAVEVREVDWEAAVQIITEPAQRVGLDWHGEAVVAALELTGRRPYLIQLLCSAIVDYLNNERRSRTVSSEVVTAVAGRFLRGQAQTASQHFNFIWPDDRQPASSEDAVRWLGRLILWVLDSHAPTPLARLEIKEHIRNALRRYGLPLPDGEAFDDEFDDQMTLLEKIFDMISPTVDDRYQFGVSLVRNWFHNRLPPEAELLRLAYAGMARDLGQKG